MINISQWWFVCVMLWNIFFPRWRFPSFYGLYQKMFSCRQTWWRLFVNISLISQFRENIGSFNFLTNALTWNRAPYPRFAIHELNCKSSTLLSCTSEYFPFYFYLPLSLFISPFSSISPAISRSALHYFEHSFHSYLSLSLGENWL